MDAAPEPSPTAQPASTPAPAPASGRVRRPRVQPKKPLAKAARHLLAYVVLRVFWGTLSRFPERVLHRLGLALGWLLAQTPLRRAAEQNIRRAYGDTPPSPAFPTPDALARACLTHYALTLMEALLLDRWQPRILQDHSLIPAGMPQLGDAIMARGNGVVVATGHIGNWELMGRALAAYGHNVWSLAKAPFDARVSDWLVAWRARGGVQVANRGSTQTVKAVKEHLKQGGGLGALVDVDTNVKSVFVPFFGIPSKTPTAAADLALKFDATLVVLWSWRERFGYHSTAFAEIPLDRTDDHQADVIRLTTRVTQVLEGAIRAHPEQWIWTHRRWKSQPPPPPPSA